MPVAIYIYICIYLITTYYTYILISRIGSTSGSFGCKLKEPTLSTSGKLPRVESLRRHPSFARPRPWQRFLLQSVPIPYMDGVGMVSVWSGLMSVCVCALFKVSYILLLYSIWCIFGILSNMQTSGEVQTLPTCSGSVCALFQLPLQESNNVETFNLGSFMWTSKLIYPLKINTWIWWNSISYLFIYKRVPNFKRHKFLHLRLILFFLL